jgi:hypothetical protein
VARAVRGRALLKREGCGGLGGGLDRLRNPRRPHRVQKAYRPVGLVAFCFLGPIGMIAAILMSGRLAEHVNGTDRSLR